MTHRIYMIKRRAGAGATVTNGKIFVAGGFDDNAPLASVEVYDPKNSTWTNIKQMMSPRGGVGLAPLSGNLVAVGGHNGSEYLKSVEIYSMTEDKWIQGPPTKRARAGSGIAWIQSDSDELEKEPAKPRLTAAVLRV
jgi:kelch-like protein 8